MLEVVTAGLVPYEEALAWQRRLASARIDRTLDHDVLLLLEHPPVITLGRASKGEHLLNPQDVPVVEVERGGDVTFHGPGQLVGYPIIDLTAHRPDLHWYLRALEQVLIDALAQLGVAAERRAGFTGVWTAPSAGGLATAAEGGVPAGRSETPGTRRKIASIGVHVKQWVTWHGFALNVTTDLTSFGRIVPCGIDGVEMTSVERETGRGDWDAAIEAVTHAFERVFNLTRVLQDASRSAD
jgi:lipoyl(octanoyl) transferase